MSSLVDVTGLVAAMLTTFSFLPQVVQTRRARSAGSLNLRMLAALTAGLVLWLVYGLATTNPPVILANAVTLFFVGILLAFKLRDLRRPAS